MVGNNGGSWFGHVEIKRLIRNLVPFGVLLLLLFSSSGCSGQFYCCLLGPKALKIKLRLYFGIEAEKYISLRICITYSTLISGETQSRS